jgi:hypothetical protein
MRIIGNVPNPDFKITLFSMNGKFLIKLEKGMLEQTYKVTEEDAANEEAVRALLTEDFFKSAREIFLQMKASLNQALNAY